mgnify:CR=1 FL=1
MTEAIRLPCGGREPPHAKPKGNIMCNGGGAFSPEEVEYLRSLPVVAEATSRRITYTESFKHNCMRRYHAGESPVELFREAGLDPSLIGYKRIERCFARWRKIACRMGTDRLVSVDGNGGVVPSASAGVVPSADSAGGCSICGIAAGAANATGGNAKQCDAARAAQRSRGPDSVGR